MPDQREIMDAVQTALNNIDFDGVKGSGDWTPRIFTALCQAGQRLDYRVCVRRDKVNKKEVTPNYGEWLYDLAWLKYDDEDWFVNTPLVAECEFSTYIDKVSEDFQRLFLLGDVCLRLMVSFRRLTHSRHHPQGLPGYLAEHIRRYRAASAKVPYVLALLHGCERGGLGFEYFLLESTGVTPLGEGGNPF